MAFFIGDSKVIKASLGATTFFFFMIALVLNTIADTNVPSMKIAFSKPAEIETTHSNSDSEKEN
jgi:hypothetical protein